ncbi:MAG: hypothetical protein ACHQEB_05505 [Chitinophagales bacterium]
MRFRLINQLCLGVLIVSVFFSCTRQTEVFHTDALSIYIPLQVGKYITYRVDSTVFTNFGRNEEIHSYQVKHVIDAQITDNLGRPSYRVYRYIRDTAATQSWAPNGTYFITPLTDQVELIEDNLRFIKLHLPVVEGNSWKGNKYLPPDPYISLYSFSNDDDMEDWDFYFDTLDSPFSYGGKNYTDVYSIEEASDSINVPVNPAAYASMTRAVEKYSKNIGLVYREYTMWEYQPNTGGPGGYKIGFGIKMWMIDHN